MARWDLNSVEGRVIEKLRQLQHNHRSFKLILYGFVTDRGKHILDMEPIPKIRLEERTPLSAAVDD